MPSRLTPIALALALLLLAPAAARATTAAAEPAAPPAARAMHTSFSADTPVAADATLTLSFAGPFPYGPGRFVVMVGGEDVTAQFEQTHPGQLRGVFAGAPLPAGATQLSVHGLDEGNAWRLLAQAPLVVAALVGGGPRAVVTPSAALQISARPWENHSASATPPPRAGELAATLDAGLATDHGDADWGLKTDLKISAVSDRSDALQYSALGNGARRLDLASYRVDGQVESPLGPSRLALGHVAAGNHPLLASAIAHRGLLATQALGERTELMLSLQSASPVLGWANPSGLADSGNRYTLASLSHELLARPGGLRAELSAFEGDIGPVASLGISPTPSRRQHSQGWGLRLLGETADQAWRGELALARSSFTDLGARPVDPADPGSAPLSASAYTLALSHTLVQALPLWNDWPFSLTASVRQERSGPAYRSLGAFGVTADQRLDYLALAATLGDFTGELRQERLQTNLAGHPSLPRRLTPGWALQMGAPLGPWLAPQQAPGAWPTLAYSAQRSTTRLDRRFAPDPLSGQLDHAVTTTHSLGLSWTLPRGSLGYTLSRVHDDDRRDAPNDSLNLDHRLSATWQPDASAELSLDLGWNPSRNFDTSLRSATRAQARSAEVSARWGLGAHHHLNAQAGYSLDHDTPLTALYPGHEWRRVVTASLSLSRDFSVPLLGRRWPAQWLLNYQHQRTDLRDGSPLALRVRYDQLSLSLAFRS